MFENLLEGKAEDFINMKIELIPVIEITNYDQDIPMPPSGPHWEFPDEWENYHISASLKVGFSESFTPYFKSSSLYRLSEISDEDLLKIIEREISELETDEDFEIEDLLSPLDGGYILKIDDVDKYFPQCCTDLSDIKDWENLLDNDEPHFYIGHPYPKVEKSGNKIVFDFLNSPIKENYAPPVFEDRIEVDKESLKIAIESAKNELHCFAQQLIKINISQNLNIPAIDKILIYGVKE
ncbi:hypothetical protein GCM10023210_34850 [Chryseobacterium ginsengisoli]|uniref:Uncharacterized protein n=1 Tax=Chryseobacterium ginsengisoli TaxID=363853 RepID=A0ABP9MP70_9FLAO